MDSKHAAFIDANRDFVLKLKIKSTEGPPQIRRVRLPRLVNDSGEISYDELVGLCVTFTFPEESRENFEVSLTYFDVDDDTVTIASAEELIDAIEQFSNAKVLRLTTVVKPKQKQAPPKFSSPGTSKTRSNANHEPINVNPQIKGALDAFVGVLSTAVRHLQEGLAAPLPETHGSHGAPSVPSEEINAASRPPAAAESSTSPTNETVPAPFVHGRHTCDSCRTSPIIGRRFHAVNIPDFDLCEACHSSKTWEGILFEEVELERDRIFQMGSSAKEKAGLDKTHLNVPCSYPRDSDVACEEEPSVAKNSNPFIHGRHTCDSCLTTPIVGKRFHAMNLPDYDLCENCHSNYTGKEVIFAAAELDRDRPFQERWRRRFEKVEKLRSKTSKIHFDHNRKDTARATPQHRLNKINEKCQKSENRCGPKVCEMLKRNEKIAHKRGQFVERFGKECSPSKMRLCRSQPPRIGSMACTNEFDDALKEAIRRSLRDIAPKEAELMDTQKPSPSYETSSAAAAASYDETSETHAEASDHDKKPVQSSTLNFEAEFVASVLEDEMKPPPSLTKEKEEELFVASSDDDLELTIACGKNLDRSPFGAEATRDMEAAMEVSSVDSEKLLSADEEMPAAVEKTSFQNDSFQSDAAGSGDVAEAVGATLDLVASMISDMLSETKSTEQNQWSTLTSSESMIVKPVGTRKSEAASEDIEWEVVDEEGLAADSENKNDDIARAAEMLGSALYNSSNQESNGHESHENVSNLSDSFSVPSTVPSINVSASQRARWSEHLTKLEELGFVDEPLIIEILERLRAAAIGVESDDEISITRVVNTILEEKKP